MLYILIALGGECCYTNKMVIAVSKDLSKIEALKNKKENENKKIKEIFSKLSQFSVKWYNENIDAAEYRQKAKIPKWPAGLDQRAITEEMRAEREKIKAFNAAVDEYNNNLQKAFSLKGIEAEKEYLKSINAFDILSESEYDANNHSFIHVYGAVDCDYAIEEIEEI